MSDATTDAKVGGETRRPSGRWITIRQIAADLGVSTSTAYKWSARGAPWFPRSIRLKNGDIRVRHDWYEEWRDSHEVSRVHPV
jgi:predicted DNA-binding transcriptional regulator AlpA